MRRRLRAAADGIVAVVAWLLFAVTIAGLLTRDVVVPSGLADRARVHARSIEFDFVSWTVNAVGIKFSQASVDAQAFVDEAARSALVRDYFGLRRELEQAQARIAQLYADPEVADPLAATVQPRAEADRLRAEMLAIQPLVEAILQEQLSVILAELGLALGGVPIPPVSFHLTPLPFALIVSPRDVIRLEANIDVSGDLPLDGQVALEDRVTADLDVSALLVPLGGIGTYPTMVAETSSLNWVAATVAHEWLHNYLTLRPLGLNYNASPQLRTMNETTAEMIGIELGALLVQRYYPDLAPPPSPFDNFLRRDTAPDGARAPAFDYRAEMHATRVTADRLLSEGRIEAAEAYMEARRVYMWEHGYQIRKLNQAYFAFYGAYAAGGGGAAGADPVGEAVRLLRRRSATIADFVNTIAWFTGYEQLRDYLGLPAS
jgi:hypothetical protein